MGGTIWLDSARGRGSTFHFTANLPAHATTSGAAHRGSSNTGSGLAVVR